MLSAQSNSMHYKTTHLREHNTMCLNKMSRTSSRNIGPQHQKYSSIFHCTHGVQRNRSFMPMFTKHILSVCWLRLCGHLGRGIKYGGHLLKRLLSGGHLVERLLSSGHLVKMLLRGSHLVIRPWLGMHDVSRPWLVRHNMKKLWHSRHDLCRL